jgi:hypothetical protein
MPTLRQVSIHPQTLERLSSGIKRKRSNTSSSSGTNNCIEPPPDDDNDNSSSAAAAASASASGAALFVPIRTPSALLSRDPAKLSADLNTSLRNIHTLRVSVAREIISNPYSGHERHATDVATAVTKFCCIHTDDNDNTIDNLQAKRRISQQHRSTPLIPGAITALDMCAHARYIKTISSRRSNQQHFNLSCIRTGSDALDMLLAPDHSYSLFDDGWSMPHPFDLPCGTINNNIDGGECFTNGSYPLQSDSERGVPFGKVTEFSGPPSGGKTQLALSIAAHAVLVNGLKVHYILGGNSRRAVARRLFAVFSALARSQHLMARGQMMMTEEEVKSMTLKKMERVHISSVPDAYSLLAILARIDNEEVAYQTDIEFAMNKSDINNGTLVIIDSVSSCLGHHLASDVGAFLASQVASTLRYMARTHDGHLHMNDRFQKPNHEQNYSTMRELRRFAVVVTNGSVVKRSFDPVPHGMSARTQSFGKQTQHQPAMGQYWHVSDVGIWLEEDNRLENDGSSSNQPISFYENTPPVALSLAEKRRVRASLLNHFGKSCRSDLVSHRHTNSVARFLIRSGGISDV